MCGIAGIVRSDGRPVRPEDLLPMVRSLSRRGPDSQGIRCQGTVGFAHTRLAIVDTEHGNQPMEFGQNLILVANGEIYNAPELRRELRHFRFGSNSDCEPILGLYEEYRGETTRHLRGMYAFALSDSLRKEVVLARDPVGIKPLYYVETDIGVAFASDSSTLLSTKIVGRKIEPNAVRQLLQRQFSIGRSTPISGIKRLLPGETIRLHEGRIAGRQRDHALPRIGADAWTETESLKNFDTAITNSVTAHLQSDVPLGLFFSGGIDSSIILALMARSDLRPLRTFTCRFEGESNTDEWDSVQRLAKIAGAVQHTVHVTDSDFVDFLPRVAAALDDPVGDYAALPTYLLGREAANHVKVVLCGEGGDELFAGYGRYRAASQWWRYHRRRKLGRGAMDGLGVLRPAPESWASQLDDLVDPLPADASILRKMQARDFAGWVPNDLMTKVDRCLMAHSVEGRVPFLDRLVIECAQRIPDRHKIHGRIGKWVLRRWLQEHFELERPFARKRGFTAPLARWIGSQGRRLGPLVSALPVIQEFCHADAVRRVFNSNDKRAYKAAYLLLFFGLWHEIHIEGRDPDGSLFDVLSSG